MNKIKAISAILFLFFVLQTLVVFGQEDWESDGEIEDVEITIVKDREITLPRANRNFDKIPPISIDGNRPQLDYFFSNLNLPLPALNIRVRPLRMKEEPLNKLYGNYIKAGFGNYVTPYLEGYFTSKRSKQNMYGAHINYLNSKNGPVDGDKSGSGFFDAEVFGKYFGSNTTVSGALGFNRNNYNFYGYPENVALNTDTLAQHFNNFNVQASLENTNKTAKIQYKTGLQFDYLTDNYEASESEVQLDFIGQFNIGENTKAELITDYDVISQKDANLEVKTRNIFRVRPSLTFSYQGFLIKAGFNTVYENDTLGNADELHFYPTARAQYSLSSGFTVFAGIDGDVEKVTLRKLVNENPFLTANTRAFNTYKTFELYGGIKGALSSKMGFGAGLSLATYKNLYFFINNPIDESKFLTYYNTENTTVLNIYGELSYNRNDLLRLSLRGDYWGYDVDAVTREPWHRPNYKIAATTTYKLYEKIRLEAEAFAIGGITALDVSTDQNVQLKAALDLNIKVDYLVSDRFSAWIRLNNILAKEYELLYRYPTRSLQVMAGITYSF